MAAMGGAACAAAQSSAPAAGAAAAARAAAAAHQKALGRFSDHTTRQSSRVRSASTVATDRWRCSAPHRHPRLVARRTTPQLANVFEKHKYHAVTIYVKETSTAHAHVHVAVPGSTPLARRLAVALLDNHVFDPVLTAARREVPPTDQLKDLASTLWSGCPPGVGAHVHVVGSTSHLLAGACLRSRSIANAPAHSYGALIPRTPPVPRTPYAPRREPRWQAHEAACREAAGLARRRAVERAHNACYHDQAAGRGFRRMGGGAGGTAEEGSALKPAA